ncbi:hypothetical protein QQF64_023877 [Cirrhinus molitorella]|uniref:DUF6570 domain-containing protein n=1 Tax=Cirrhinus molitorella TaxID=172907 RepID=A0ABR3NJW8_9TELE
MYNRTRYVTNVQIAASCLTGKYVQLVTVPVQFLVQFQKKRQERICHTCDSHLKRGSMPSIAVPNKIELPHNPAELLELNVLEQQLIARIVPFAKNSDMPKGQQRAVHGAVVCVPSEVEKTVNGLPRPTCYR